MQTDRLQEIGYQLALGWTFQEIADEMELSKQRVHQIWNARKRVRETVRTCKHCKLIYLQKHGNQKYHPKCAEIRRKEKVARYLRRMNNTILLTLPDNNGTLSVGLVYNRMARGWTQAQATTIPKGQRR